MAMYQVKEIFYTLQGEGSHSGRPAVFMRFSGCNLWSGREVDRNTAHCQFCDTDFVGVDGENGGKFSSADDLARKAALVANSFILDNQVMIESTQERAQHVSDLLIVLTGGEPLLQVDENLLKALKAKGFEIAIETNGTIKAPEGIDWICVSPKAGTDIVQRSGQELKLVYGQEGLSPKDFEDWDFEHFYLQPMDTLRVSHKRGDTSQIKINGETDSLTDQVIAYCKAHPKWKLSLQTHKILNIA